MILVPKPQKIEVLNGFFDYRLLTNISLNCFNCNILKEELTLINSSIIFLDDSSGIMSFIYDDSLEKEAYKIEVEQERIKVYASSEQGAFYAIQTFKQIFNEQLIPCLKIEDYPDLKIRGIMLDISRSKVPTIDTLKELVKLFASIKINHLELYVEGFSFEYESFQDEIAINHNYFSLKDLKILETFCNERFIDLVPNQNGLGHMADWLALDQYHNLAECENGFFIWGADRPASTLDVSNSKSIELVKKLYDDMLPHFKSKYFHMNFDEPFELGLGKNKELVDKLGKDQVFIDYFNKLNKHVKTYDKTPLIWGDVLIKYPQSLSKLPKDIIFVDWGYNHQYDFESHAEMLELSEVNFMLAPGTVSWGNILGNDLDMSGSIEHASLACKKHHGLGMLITDWGDIGHLQYLPVSIPGFIYGGSLAWSSLSKDDLVAATENYFKQKGLGSLIIKLSKFIQLEGPYRDYGCRLFYTILWAEHASRNADPVSFFLEKMKYNLIDEVNIKQLSEFFDSAQSVLDSFEDTLVVNEIKNSIFLLKILLDINVKLTIIYKQNEDEIDFQKEISLLKIYSEEHLKLWNARNIHAGYKMSNQRILWLTDLLASMKNRKETK